MLEPIPVAYGQIQCAPFNESSAHCQVWYVAQGYLSSTPLVTWLICNREPFTSEPYPIQIEVPLTNLLTYTLQNGSCDNIWAKIMQKICTGIYNRDVLFPDLLIICIQQSNFTGNYLHSQHCKQTGERLQKNIVFISPLFVFFNLHSYLYSMPTLTND